MADGISSKNAFQHDRPSIVLRSRRRVLPLAVLAITVFASEASAQLFYAWNNPSGGSYSSAVNWFPGAGALPGIDDGAEFGLLATYVVDFFSDAAINDVLVSNGVVTWNLGAGGTPHTYTAELVDVRGFNTNPTLIVQGGQVRTTALRILDGAQAFISSPDSFDADAVLVSGVGTSLVNNTSALSIGSIHTGTMRVENGAGANSLGGYIGLVSGVNGTVTVTGPGSNWTADGGMLIGDRGAASLTVSNGGVVSNHAASLGDSAGGTGLVFVDGNNSQWLNSDDLRVGVRGIGALSITDGGFVSSPTTSIGHNVGSSGFVTITGSNSKLSTVNNSVFTFSYVGFEGTGTMNIQDGGAVESTGVVIGRFSGSRGHVIVKGAGSTWTDGGALIIGMGGAGELNIAQGGAVSNGNTLIGFNSSAVGTVTVDGASSIWTSAGDLDVGAGGQGTLAITSGGTVSSINGGVGTAPGGQGIVSVSGATSMWTISGDFMIGNGGTGLLTVADGGLVSANGLVSVGASGTIQGNGTINGNVTNGGIVAPGTSAGAAHRWQLHGDGGKPTAN